MREEEKTNRNITRETNLELLRIIAMLMIILHHFALYSGFSFSAEDEIIKKIIVDVLSMFGKLGVTLFIIISGYFYDKSNFKLHKLLRLLTSIWTYSMIGLIIGITIKSNEVNFINIIKSIFPFVLGRYWFATCYILIYVFSPYTKIMIDKMERKELKSFLLLALVFFSCISAIPKAKMFANEFIILELVYFLGAYIKKYNVNILKNKERLVYTVIITISMILIMIMLEILSNKITILKNNDEYIRYFNKINSPFIIGLTVLIFNIFRNLKLKNSSLINSLASTTFGIYLIHENIFLREVIWQKIFILLPKTRGIYLVFSGITETILIFLIGACIDYVMQNTIIKIINKLAIEANAKVSKLKILKKV